MFQAHTKSHELTIVQSNWRKNMLPDEVKYLMMILNEL